MLQLGALRFQVDGLRLCGLELALGQRDVGSQHDTGSVLVLRQRQGARVASGGGSVQVALQIDHADLEIVLRHAGLDAQARAGEVVGTGLHVGIAGLDRAPHGAPYVGLPAGAEAGAVVGAESGGSA